MKQQHTLQPKLRFPEFEEKWNSIKLGDLMTFKNGVNASKENYGFGYKFINVLDIINNNIITNDIIIGEVSITEKEFEKNIVQYGDILFQRSSETREEVGQSNVYLDETPATFGGFVIRGKSISEYNSLYLHYLLKTSKARLEITTKSGGSTRFNVGQETLSNVIIKISSSLPEQQKIADYLSTIDTKINLLEEKKAQLSLYKKAMMQKLFSQEIRFKPVLSGVEGEDNGNDFPEWEEKRLGDVLIEKLEKSTVNNQYEILSSTVNDIFLQKDYFTRDIASKDNIGYKVLKLNQLVFSPQNVWMGNLNVNTKFDIGLVSPSYKIFDFKNVSVAYFKYFLKTPKMIKEYLISSEQGASVVRRNLNLDLFKQIKLLIPSVKEQQKIADFLSAIDASIEKVNEQISQTQSFKKAMLQQLFV